MNLLFPKEEVLGCRKPDRNVVSVAQTCGLSCVLDKAMKCGEVKRPSLHYDISGKLLLRMEGKSENVAVGGTAKEDSVQYSLSIAQAYWVLCPTCLAFLLEEKDWQQ